MKTKFCTYCGIEIEEGWSICPDCGNKIYESTNQKTQPKNPFQARFRHPNKQEYPKYVRRDDKFAQKVIFGNLALTFGILSLVSGFIFVVFLDRLAGIILEIIFAILAMVFGGIVVFKREINYRALGGLILGGLNLMGFWYLLLFLFN